MSHSPETSEPADGTVVVVGVGNPFRSDDAVGTAVARRLRTGTLGVNGGMWFAPDSPFGGYKQSGVGREMGIEGFEEYLETKTIGYPAA